MLISKQFKFNSAHHLPNYKGKCENVHGHTYKLCVTLEGKPQKNGMILDFKEIEEIVERYVLAKVDHKDLNSIFDNPSTENIAVFIWNELLKKFPSHVKLYEIGLCETESSCVTYRGNLK